MKREANLAAHGLAKFATRNIDSKVWPEEPPSCILDTAILEQLALSMQGFGLNFSLYFE